MNGSGMAVTPGTAPLFLSKPPTEYSFKTLVSGGVVPTQLRRLFPREAEQLVSENTRAEDASLLYEVQTAWAGIHHGVELQSWIQAFEYIMDMDRVTPYPKYQRQANWMQLRLVASRLIQGDPCWDDGRWLVIRWDIDYVHSPEDRRWASM